jgi:hypothetical protein
MIIFCIDIVVSFFVGYFDETGALVVDSRRVALKYARCEGAGGWGLRARERASLRGGAVAC